jgi:hypothetical protein
MNLMLGLAGVALVAVLAVGCANNALTAESTAAGPSADTATPAIAASESPSSAPSALASASGATVLDTRTIADDFALPMKATLPDGWKTFHDIKGTLGFVNVGNPPGPDTTWWGLDLALVEDAQIHDPSDVVSSEPAKSDRSRFVPWPGDFFGYITGLPEVEVVSGPEPITIGGITGTQIDVKTPPMHPLIWMAGDYTWLGGGKTGVDPATEHRFVELKTGGHTLLITGPGPGMLTDHSRAAVQAILDSISFD